MALSKTPAIMRQTDWIESLKFNCVRKFKGILKLVIKTFWNISRNPKLYKYIQYKHVEVRRLWNFHYSTNIVMSNIYRLYNINMRLHKNLFQPQFMAALFDFLKTKQRQENFKYFENWNYISIKIEQQKKNVSCDCTEARMPFQNNKFQCKNLILIVQLVYQLHICYSDLNNFF